MSSQIHRTVVGDVRVSTIKLPPDFVQPFETAIFGGPFDGQAEYHASLVEAEQGHVRWVEKVRQA